MGCLALPARHLRVTVAIPGRRTLAAMDPRGDSLRSYLAESYLPRIRGAELRDAARRARLAADALAAEGLPVRHVRTSFLPDDEVCLHLFEAPSADAVSVAMRASSQPGDLAYAKGKLYVAEEFGSPPAIAIADAASGEVLSRIFTGPRPHHMHASVGGNLIAYGVFGTNRVGIIDTRSDTL